MIHTFSATAYEVEELSYENLLNLGFINLVKPEEIQVASGSMSFQQAIDDAGSITKDTQIQINNQTIVNLLRVHSSQNSTGSASFYVRIVTDQLVLIQSGRELWLESNGTEFPNVYISAGDNAIFWTDETTNFSDIATNSTALKAWLKTLVGDTVLTYEYSNSVEQVGEFNNFADVYIENKIETAIGSSTLQFDRIGVSGNTEVDSDLIEIIKFFVLDFQEKAIIKIQQSGSGYNDMSDNPITYFDRIYLYQLGNDYYYGTNSSSLGEKISAADAANLYSVYLRDEQGKEYSFTELPNLNLDNLFFTLITIGPGVILNYAYQRKVTKYRTGG